MNNVLFISTIHRMSERFLPAIIHLMNNVNSVERIAILNLGQASKHTCYESNLRYTKKIDKISNKINVYNGPPINNKRDVRSENFCFYSLKLISDICQKHKINTIILDDSRQSILNIYIGNFCKNNGIFLFANAHGITDEPNICFSLNEPFYDKILVFGKKEAEFHNTHCGKNICIPVGIPENDIIKEVKTSEEQITVIVNRVVIDVPQSPGERMFDEQTLKDMRLIDLQKKFNLPVVFKIKDRMSDNTQRDVDAIKNFAPKNLIYDVVVHVDDEIDFLSRSKIVLSYGSGMNFKSMQMMIPTIVFKGLGVIGVFEDYYGTVEIGEDYFEKLYNLMSSNQNTKIFLEKNLEGSLNFTSTEIYCNAIGIK